MIERRPAIRRTQLPKTHLAMSNKFDIALDLSLTHSPPNRASWSEGDTLQSAIALVHDELSMVERELAQRLESAIAMIPNVAGHLTFAGGKRFRPLVTLLAAHAVAMPTKIAVVLAAVGELLHSATLLHDDVVDEGDFRRGRPSARYKYGNAMAVLTGDFCLARALEAVAALGQPVAVHTMAKAVTRMAEGEVAQLECAGDSSMNRDRYYMVIDRKTAALIAWCTSLAGLAPCNHSADLERYGLELGYAFQIADDIIDYRSDLATSGKARLQDLREGKLTLPLLIACEQDNALKQRVADLLRRRRGPLPDDEVLAIGERVAQLGALDRAHEIAAAHGTSAREALESLPHSASTQALAHLADYVSRRST
jgi:octaprenyl-diphosphate synthase